MSSPITTTELSKALGAAWERIDLNSDILRKGHEHACMDEEDWFESVHDHNEICQILHDHYDKAISGEVDNPLGFQVNNRP